MEIDSDSSSDSSVDSDEFISNENDGSMQAIKAQMSVYYPHSKKFERITSLDVGGGSSSSGEEGTGSLQKKSQKDEIELLVPVDDYITGYQFQLKVLRALIRRRIYLLFRGRTVAFLSIVAPFCLIFLSCLVYFPLQHLIVPQHVEKSLLWRHDSLTDFQFNSDNFIWARCSLSGRNLTTSATIGKSQNANIVKQILE